MDIVETLNYLDKHEIDYRLVSNFCCGYIFYFLDGSIYPRRNHDLYLDNELKSNIQKSFKSVDVLIEETVHTELKKDWIHRIEGKDLKDTFRQVKEYLISKN